MHAAKHPRAKGVLLVALVALYLLYQMGDGSSSQVDSIETILHTESPGHPPSSKAPLVEPLSTFG